MVYLIWFVFNTRCVFLSFPFQFYDYVIVHQGAVVWTSYKPMHLSKQGSLYRKYDRQRDEKYNWSPFACLFRFIHTVWHTNLWTKYGIQTCENMREQYLQIIWMATALNREQDLNVCTDHQWLMPYLIFVIFFIGPSKL